MRRIALALLLLGWLARPALAEPWKVGVLIYRETNATATIEGTPVTVQATMTSGAPDPTDEIEELRLVVKAFERLVVDWSDGLAEIEVAEPKVVLDPITHVTYSGGAPGPEDDDDTVWVTPADADVGGALTEFLTLGDYDSVVVFWHSGPDSDGLEFPVYGGETDYTTYAGKRISYSALPLNGGVLYEAVRGESVLHEWLHGVDIHHGGGDGHAGNGYIRDPGPLIPDSSKAYNYKADASGSFEEFYRDILRGRVRVKPNGPEYFGVSAAVWSAGTILSEIVGMPLPAQLVEPVEGACVGLTPTLRWRGPSGPGITWEVTIESVDGPPLGYPPQAVTAQSFEVPSGVLTPGARYLWRVRAVSGGVYSAAPEELWFIAGDRPATPTISPASGGIPGLGAPLRISSTTPSAVIYYTVDGSTPTGSSPVFTGPVDVMPGQEVRAVASHPACGNVSAVASADYATAGAFLVTNTDSNGPGSLAQAVSDAALAPGANVIEFLIPGPGPHVIQPSIAPAVGVDELFIDGRTQPGYSGTPQIEIRGSYSGYVAGAGGVVIRSGMLAALSITGFGDYGVTLIENGGSTVLGCWIGVSPDGTPRPNFGPGIFVNTPGNYIGGLAPQGNLISGNGTWGVSISGPGAFGNEVHGNYIGTNAAGTARISNVYGGILIDNAPFNRIGGTESWMGNLISGNGFSTGPGDGIAIANEDAVGNLVQGNRIGTTAAGNADLGNSRFGVNISITTPSTGASASGNLIGGTEPGAGNVIAGNDATGIVMLSNNGEGGGFNKVQGNWIGTDVSGLVDLGNGSNGVSVARATVNGLTPSGNLIGGRVSAARNVISGNAFDGVAIIGSSATGNTVQGNYIGTDSQGIFPNPNGRSGVRLNVNGVALDGATNNLIGGASAGASNVITGNGQDGVAIIGGTTGGSGNAVQGNRIGVSATLGSTSGNGPDGVLVSAGPGRSASGNLIGGRGLGAGNVIGGATSGAGIRIDGAGAAANVVQGNYVGVDPSGDAHPNSGPGIQLNAPSNGVGGGSNARNVVAQNGGPGVLVSSGSGNLVLTNSIHSNGALGIDLTSGNLGAIAPVLASAVPSHGTLVRGSLTAAPLSEYTIELFSSAVCDPSGAGEGAVFLGSGPLVTDASGVGEIAAIVTTTVQLGEVVTATATDEAGANTSEFSNCIASTVGPPGDPDGDGTGDNCPARPGLDQNDSGGVGTTMPDGHGDDCQCGDIDDDGVVDAADTALYRTHLADPGGVPLLGEARLKCSTIGADPLECDLLDVVVMRRALGGQLPEVAQVCEADTL